MEDFMKKSPTNKIVSHTEKHHKTHYRGMHHAHPPYDRGDMHKAMCVSQGKQGIGVASPKYEKAPMYDVYGEVKSVTHGHMKVGPKI